MRHREQLIYNLKKSKWSSIFLCQAGTKRKNHKGLIKIPYSGNKTAIIMIAFALSLNFTSCSKENKDSAPKENINNLVINDQIDTLQIALNMADSISNCGQLVHADIYEIGKIKTISVTVQKISAGDNSITYINLRKDCGGEYYYSWEDKRIFKEEVKYFIAALDTIKNNMNRTVNHEERYAYVTKDNIRAFLVNENKGKGWKFELSVDILKNNSTIYLKKEEIDDLKNILQTSFNKINKISI